FSTRKMQRECFLSENSAGSVVRSWPFFPARFSYFTGDSREAAVDTIFLPCGAHHSKLRQQLRAGHTHVVLDADNDDAGCTGGLHAADARLARERRPARHASANRDRDESGVGRVRTYLRVSTCRP